MDNCTGIAGETAAVMQDNLQSKVEQLGGALESLAIKMADYVIDMGPDGGRGGGQLLSCGTPEEVALSSKGYTPKFLREELNM